MSSRNRVCFGSGFERLEDRTVPAIIDLGVNTTADTPLDHVNHPMPGVNIPVDVNNNTSLRAVVQYMNANPQTGDPATNKYNVDFTPVAGQTITLDPNRGTLVINSNASFLIEGFSKNGTTATIQRDPNAATNFRLFSISQDRVVSLENLNLTGGVSDSGGAIANYGSLSLYKCSVYSNQATGSGGAIWSGEEATSLVLDQCSLWYNQAVGYGGAIAAFDSTQLTISATDIFSNSATGTGVNQGYGGGVYIYAPDAAAPWFTLNARIYGNSATKDGGGVYVWNTGLVMDSGEIHGNSAGGYGGGIYVEAPGKTVTVSQVKLTNNSAGAKGGGAYARKGTLKLQYLTAFSGNSATGGIAGAGYKQNDASITVIDPPAGAQAVEADP